MASSIPNGASATACRCSILPVAQRLGYPIYPVVAPDHMFVRYVEPAFKEQNIETTSGGKYFTDESYIQNFSVSKRGLESGSYMRTLTYRQFLGHMLAANAFVRAREGQGEKAIAYSERAIQLDPQFADFYDDLQTGYLAWSQVVDGELATKYRDRAKRYGMKAKELGFVAAEQIAIDRKGRGQ
jgi:hypothetical protein